jgi:endonuclease G
MTLITRIARFVLSVGLLLLLPASLWGQDGRYAPEVKGVSIENTCYRLDFNAEHKQPNWVYYSLTQTHITGDTPRSSSFRNCRQGDIRSATNNDYRGSGYDKGHLCPAADMKHSREAMSATFQMWNMSPQEPSFNRGKLADLESLVRSYIRAETDTLFVVTGPVFLNNKGSIGESGVTVPGLYYKVVYCPERGGAAFLLPNQKVSGPLRSWQVSIDLVEVLTGIDFFPQLPDKTEDEIESQVVWWEYQ